MMEYKASLDKLALAAEQNVKEREYWLKQLGTEWSKSIIPYDFGNENKIEQKKEKLAFNFPIILQEKLARLSSGSDVKLHMVLVAGLVILLHKYTGNQEISIGSPILKQEIEGDFINTILVFKTSLEPGYRFRDLLLKVRETIIQANEHQNYPMDILIDQLGLDAPGPGDVFPLFDIVLLLENLHDKRYLGHINYNILFSFSGNPLSPAGILEYNAALYQPGTMQRVIDCYLHTLDQVLTRVDITLREVDILPVLERQKIIEDFNLPASELPGPFTLEHWFEDQVVKTPDHIALVGIEYGAWSVEDMANHTSMDKTGVSYQQLNLRANTLAQLLIVRGVRPGSIVAIMVEPSIEMFAGILGILKAGGAYLPLDPDYPDDRVNFILQDSGAVLLLTVKGWAMNKQVLPAIEIVDLESTASQTGLAQSTQTPGWVRDRSSAQDLAYVIYTSGTTGKPKGVLVEHRNVTAYLHAFFQEFEILATDTVIQLASFTFDVFVEEVFPVLLRGGNVVIPGPSEAMDIGHLTRLMVREHVTIIDCTPLLLSEFNRQAEHLKHLRLIISGGDVLKPAYIDRLAKSGSVYNTYGPTETTVCATYYRYTHDMGILPIGKPIAHYQLYILDEYHFPVPIGVPGEICVAGAGVTRGYLNRPELTVEKFLITDEFPLETREEKGDNNRNQLLVLPLNEEPTATNRLYKTGDLGRWLTDGNIEFLGRIDHQVKIRGYRIETGEIESWLMNHPSVNEAVVLAREDKEGDKYLCAYIVPVSPVELQEIREWLGQQVPGYMVPSFFIPLDVIPRTANGKLDRRALPDPGLGSGEQYVPPQTITQERMQKIWHQAFGLERIGIFDDFFKLGGHSLKGIQLLNMIHQEFDVKIPLAEMFKDPTIHGLSLYIKDAAHDPFASLLPSEKKEYYPLSSAQKRLYFLQQMDSTSTSYNMPFVYPLEKNVEHGKLETTLKNLIARHDCLRTGFIQVNDNPVQRVCDKVPFAMPAFSFNENNENQEAALQKFIQEFVQPFDLSLAPLLRSAIVSLPGHRLLWIVDIHHIISDGTSHTILVRDFMSLYQGEILEPLKIQYKDYSCWQNQLFASGEIQVQQDYWFKLFKGEIPRLNLPADFPRPDVFSFAGDVLAFRIPEDESLRFRELGANHGATLYMNFMAALNTLFYKYTGQTDIIIGSTTANRRHADLQHIVGMFVNSLATRHYPEGEKTYMGFLAEVIQESLKAFENQDVQFEELVEALDVERDPSRNPIFDICMLVENYAGVEEKPGQKETQQTASANKIDAPERLAGATYRHTTSKFDITFFVHEINGQVHIIVEYYTAIFKAASIIRLVSHLLQVIRTVSAQPAIELKDIDIVTGREKERLLYQLNDTQREYPREIAVYRLFEKQVERTPGAIAVSAAPSLSLTYQELNEQANRLAHHLHQQKGVGPGNEQKIGISLSHPFHAPAAIFGILKAGGAYVPLDPTLPLERIRYMIADAQIHTIISEKKYIRDLNRWLWECPELYTVICLDSIDIYHEEEVEKSQLMNEELWEHVGQTAVDEITGGGWVSSYTGEPFSKKEMDEYGENIVKKLTPLLHQDMRVLEIGCASGITMYRIAPHVAFYYGTDLSHITIEKNQQRVREEGQKNIALACIPADMIDTIGENNFDLVIINSVIHCFHGHNYLRHVIKKILDLISPQGYLFIGDIMDQELKQDLIRDMHSFKQSHPDKNYPTKMDWSGELFVARGFFQDLAIDFPVIHGLEFTRKIHTVENELTQFRYDTLITIDKTGQQPWVSHERHKFQEDQGTLAGYSSENPDWDVDSHHLAYIIYTSGTTGKPKGVMVEHQSLVNYAWWAIDQYIVQGRTPGASSLVFPLYTNLSFDLTVTSIFLPLLTGNQVIVYSQEESRLPLLDVVRENQVDIIKATPSHLKLMRGGIEYEGKSSRLQRFIVGGEALERHLAFDISHVFGGDVDIFNEYGPTEATVGCMIYRYQRDIDQRLAVPIGGPIANVQIYLLDNYLKPVPVNAVGEIFIAGDALARGYLNRPLLTAEKFIENPFIKGARMYRTGDLARFLPEEKLIIEFLGRVDEQVKVRGYRIELKEIENRLLLVAGIEEALVIAREDDNGDTSLCAYFVTGKNFETSLLREHLAADLPEYMIPSFFVEIERIPLTANGKVDLRALPKPVITVGDDYVPPADDIERALVRIWSEVLGLDKTRLSVEANFFQVGGHSLKATILVSAIHKAFDVKIPLARVFKTPTIRGLAHAVAASEIHKYSAIEPVETREYYPLSSAQKRMYFLQEMEPGTTSYNMSFVLPLEPGITKEKIEKTLKQLIARHETLRTSFERVEQDPVQRVHENVDFNILVHHVPANRGMTQDEQTRFTREFIRDFIRPFDLAQAPLIRASILTLPNGQMAWLTDIHHIVSDGTSNTVLIEDFIALYHDRQLEPLRIQYKDFSQWQNRLFDNGMIAAQERYWMDLYKGEIPRLQLPTDYKRPDVFTFAGAAYEYRLNNEDIRQFQALGMKANGTLYMNIMAALNVLFYRYTGQTDIIIGSGIAGRPHADLEKIVGMFVNTLALRNAPHGKKTYEEFLYEVIDHCVTAFENQDVQFEELVERLGLARDPSRNPLFDISMVVQNFRQAGEGFEARPRPRSGQAEQLPALDTSLPGVQLTHTTAKFDITVFLMERDDDIQIGIEYYTGIFKPATIQRMASHLGNIIKSVSTHPGQTLDQVLLLSEEEKQQVLFTFNDTAGDIPPDMTMISLFMEQVERVPDRVALVYEACFLSFRELDYRGNQLARYLDSEVEICPGTRVGIIMSDPLFLAIALLGVLKAGAVYIPLDPALPGDRLRYMIADAGVTTVISEKRYIKLLNRLQWECESFNRFLCLDSRYISREDEEEKSELMEVELWHHVGETATDEITGGGWVSSYTGDFFSQKEMDEYGHNILMKLKPLLDKELRVLEIGCASGISMFRIAPLVGTYYGTDLSGIIIEKNKARALAEGHQNIHLFPLAAHEIDQLTDITFDLIIINSVIQCFHGHNYLRKVVRKCLDRLGNQGHLFIGDIMDQDLKKALVRDMNVFKTANRDKGYTTKTDFSSELFISRKFWLDLVAQWPEIESVDFSGKYYTIENELTKFRYDTLFRVNKKKQGKKGERKRLKYQDDARMLDVFGGSRFPVRLTPSDLAYIIYTSGTTGRPKGVEIEHRGVANTLAFRRDEYDMGISSRSVQLFSYSFDGFITSFFTPLISGASQVLLAREHIGDIDIIRDILVNHQVSHLLSVPALFNTLIQSARPGELSSLKTVTLAGDKISSDLITWTKNKNHTLELVNEYGVTESSVMSTIYRHQEQDDTIKIGHPIRNTQMFICAETSGVQPIGVAGELIIGGVGIARGYLNQPELTSEKFIRYQDFSFLAHQPGKNDSPGLTASLIPASQERDDIHYLYKTGDLARWLPDGNIEFLGRKDHQVKVRGFRIETGEIESRLREHGQVIQAVVIDREVNQEKHLCAYMTLKGNVEIRELVEYLGRHLPEYMIPSYFTIMEKIPGTVSGKVDRKALPAPGITVQQGFTAPRDDMERRLAGIWAEILNIDGERIGIDDNFFELGGHSLKATLLASKIHKACQIKIPLAEIFKSPTIRGLARYASLKGLIENKYATIETAEQQEYYPLSSAQKRMFFLQQMDLTSTSYNMTMILPLVASIEPQRIERVIQQLIQRHESLRTSFIMIGPAPVQRVHPDVVFNLEYFGNKGEKEIPESINMSAAQQWINDFIRPFNLATAPLLRSAIARLQDNYWLWLVDMHHIISDGTSQEILAEDFTALYNDQDPGAIRLQYKDFSHWQNHLIDQGEIKQQQDYWLKLFTGEIPRLHLLGDRKRPEVFSFVGGEWEFALEKDMTMALQALALKNNATLYMTTLAILNAMFYKYTGQEDIIIGSGIAGRPHADLQRIVGMFINTLVMRNYPRGGKPFTILLSEVCDSSIKAFENQDVQFEELVELLNVERDPSRNPLFDVSMVVQNFQALSPTPLPANPYSTKDNRGEELIMTVTDHSFPHTPFTTAKFDLTFFIFEQADHIHIKIEYYKEIFNASSISRMATHFNSVVKAVIAAPGIKLDDIELVSPGEKEKLLYRFNETIAVYPGHQTIAGLLAGQVEKSPQKTALWFENQGVSYSELDTHASLVARYLGEIKNTGPEDRVGVMMSHPVYCAVAIWGILKAGAAYVPLDPSLPVDRLAYMIKDSAMGVLISEKMFIRTLNHLQWTCPGFHSFLCLDSDDIRNEAEPEKSELMNPELWRLVGESAQDEIDGGGWVNSFTGEPISAAEMGEYGDNILKKLEPLLHKQMRVLEIGCASGISMFRIAPRVGLYWGTDLSDVIIKKNKQLIKEKELTHIHLTCLPAHEIETLPGKNFDLIILNSVIQCFHGHNYLWQVIQQCLRLMNDQGYLFIGDVMDLEKKSQLETELKTFKLMNRDKGYQTKTDFSSELFVSRAFWQDLAAEMKSVQTLQFSDKIHTIENELTRFRYDLLITVDKTSSPGVLPGKITRVKQKYQDDRRLFNSFTPGTWSPVTPAQPGNLAYIIYTSGTTGRPKGVEVQHQGVVNTLWFRAQEYRMDSQVVSLQLFSFGFDGFVTSFFTPLISGAQVVLLRREDIGNIEKIRSAIVHYQVTHLLSVPALYAALIDALDKEEAASLRVVTLAGDQVNRLLVQQSLEKNSLLEIVNEYGVTEGSVMSTIYRHQERDDTIKIGHPIANTQLLIIDKNCHLQPLGIAGELVIGGMGVARGYLNNPGLTAEKFVSANHFQQYESPDPAMNAFLATCFYKSGDLARWLEDGNIEFLGRIDHQVKIRGFRIETGEIESRLSQHEQVIQAVVIDREVNQEKHLCAYITLKQPVHPAELTEYLGQYLPEYMIPSYFTILDEIPVTMSGKVDRQALPIPGIGPKEGFTAPRDDTQRILAGIWAELLNIPGNQIDIDTNFFELGGHSLKATLLTARIHKVLNIKIPLAEIFKSPTIRGLARYASIKGLIDNKYADIESIEKKEYYPLSSAQKRMYFLQHMEPNSTSYNMTMVLPLASTIDPLRIEKVLQQLNERHESLRTSFILIDGEPVQRVHETLAFSLENRGDLDDTIDNIDGNTDPAQRFIASFIRPFDLSNAPLMRSAITRLKGGMVLWLVDLHHAISDGTSQSILASDFIKLYSGQSLTPLRLQYRDFSQWQNQLLASDDRKQQETYWLQLYAGEIPRLNLLADKERPQVFTFAGGVFEFDLDPKDASLSRALAIKKNATLYMDILAILNVLFFKYTGQEDIIIGTGIAGRPHIDLQPIVGMFINTLVMRNYPQSQKSFDSFLDEVIESSIKAFENQDVQFEELVTQLQLERDPSRNPLFDVSMVVQNFQSTVTGKQPLLSRPGEHHQESIKPSELLIPALDLPPITMPNSTAKFDLTFHVIEQDEDIHIKLEYYKEIFTIETIQRLARHFARLLHTVVENPGIRLQAIDFLSPAEKKLLLDTFNQTSQDYSFNTTLLDLVENRMEKNQDCIAMASGQPIGWSRVKHYPLLQVSYGELNQKSNQLAWLLQEKGVGPGSIVGVWVESSVEMIVAVFAIWKAGGAYLPIDPAYPNERIRLMLADSHAGVLLTSAALEPHSKPLTGLAIEKIILEESEKTRPTTGSHSLKTIEREPSLPAYVIYTSGSTGRPKGVVVEHRGIVNTLLYRVNEYAMISSDVSLQLFSFGFDGFITSFFTPFIAGVKVILLSREQLASIDKIKDIITKEQVTHFISVPVLYATLLDNLTVKEAQGLKKVTLAGDKLDRDLLTRSAALNPDLEIVNEYGVTEAAVMSTIYRHQEGDNTLKIGHPIGNTQLYILDPALYLQPVGVAGEIFIGGVGVARGYLNNPVLTAEKFLFIHNQWFEKHDPADEPTHLEQPGTVKLYRTGDLGRWLDDGHIEFFGRIDNQVKIRGFRIELGEIEARLKTCPGIKEAVVIDRTGKDGQKYLYAYYLAPYELMTPDIRYFLSQRLPDYMIPAFFIYLTSLPITASGKIDRKNLPALAEPRVQRFMAPDTGYEKQIANIWAEVLNLEWENIGVETNFFEIGGNSIHLLKINKRIQEVLGTDISIAVMFRFPTVRGLAQYLLSQRKTREPQPGEKEKELPAAQRWEKLRELKRTNNMEKTWRKQMIEGKEQNGETGLEIAVIGMAARFPGAPDVDKFWENLKQGSESISFFTQEELEHAGIDAKMRQNPLFVAAAGCIDDGEYFDAAFFGYPAREAEVIDPEVRLFHEVVWHALEDAACDPGTYNGAIGLYAGASANFEWLAKNALSRSGSTLDPFMAKQLQDKDFMCVHVSYRLNLKGPSIILSTACSTSLVAIVMACQSLLSGECDMALAGGTCVQLPRARGYIYKEGMISSPDGHCRAFDANASGIVGGNGVGVVAFKLLNKARQDRNHIYAIVKGVALNNDGMQKAGFTAPSVDGQTEVIRAAQQMARVPAESITYIEAHGTGTLLGDPVEVEALKLAFNTDKRGFCGIGSVKSNIGHLDSAAGVAGFIKTCLALYHQTIPPTLHVVKPNPKIDFKNSPFYVNTTLRPWFNPYYPLRAGVSSFGIGGTNAHVVLEEAPALPGESNPDLPGTQRSTSELLVLSARSEEALERMTNNLVEFLKTNPDVNLKDTAFTLQSGRKRFPFRRSAVCTSTEEALHILSTPGHAFRHTFHSREDKRPVVFMFPGQGAQYVDMGRDLYQQEPVFREAMDRCFTILSPLLGTIDLKTILYPLQPGVKPGENSGLIDQTYLAQPVIFTVEYALALLLMSWGITPYAMIGHSIGEYVAAHLAGVFSLEDSLQLVAMRGKLMQDMEAGSMMSIPLAAAELVPLLPARVELAAINTPNQCTVSGPQDNIQAFKQQLELKGIEARPLHTSHAYHSAMMEPMLAGFEKVVRELKREEPRLPFISNLTGNWITMEDAMDPSYWSKHLRQTVRFSQGISRLLEEKYMVFLEVGPGMSLSTFVGKHPLKEEQKTFNLLRHPKENIPDHSFLINKIGQLWLHGITIDWQSFHRTGNPRRIRLPYYPFDKMSFGQGPAAISSIAEKPAIATGSKNWTDWFYQSSWIPVQLPPPPATLPFSPCCLVFKQAEGATRDWEKNLVNHGVEVIEVLPGKEYLKESPSRYVVNPADTYDYRRLFLKLQEDGKFPGWILHAWSLAEPPRISPEPLVLSQPTIAETLQIGFYSLLYLARAVSQVYLTQPVRLLFISNQAQGFLGEQVIDPGQAASLGIIKTISREFPGWICRGIDIADNFPGQDGLSNEITGNLLISEFLSDNDEPVVVYTRRQRWVESFSAYRLKTKPGSASTPIRNNGVYLVTGGLGGMGLTLAQSLCQKEKVKLILMGRSSLPNMEQWSDWLDHHEANDPVAIKIRELQTLQNHGAELLLMSADVSNPEQMEKLVQNAEARFGSINGIIHAAGVADAGMIMQRTEEMTQNVFAAKIRGTLVLDQIFRERQLDFFVMCSSLASIVAPPGQVAYTAANIFLDAYALYCQQQRPSWKHVTAINWDSWLEKGMAADAIKKIEQQTGRTVDMTSMPGILPNQGQEIFSAILAENKPRLIISTREPNQLLAEFQAGSATGLMTGHEPTTGLNTGATTQPGTTREPGTGPEGERPIYQRPHLSTEYVAPDTEREKMIAEMVRLKLGIDRVGVFDNFFDLGLSSVDVINMANQLKEIPGLEIATVNIFENPTVHALAQFIDQQLSGTAKEEVNIQPERLDEIDTGKNRFKQMMKKSKKSNES